MTQIKKITDKQGNDIYLRTHTKAVVDDNGYTAESRLQAMQDEINQKQLEVGAVPSDLTPTGGSSNWVTSGGVYKAIEDSSYIITEHFNISGAVVTASNSAKQTIEKTETGFVISSLASGSNIYAYCTIPNLEIGKTYTVSLDYNLNQESTSASAYPYFLIISTDNTRTTRLGGVVLQNRGLSGSVKITITPSTYTTTFYMANNDMGAGCVATISNISVTSKIPVNEAISERDETLKIFQTNSNKIEYLTGSADATFDDITEIGRTDASIIDISLDSETKTIKYEATGAKTFKKYAWFILPSTLINGQKYIVKFTYSSTAGTTDGWVGICSSPGTFDGGGISLLTGSGDASFVFTKVYNKNHVTISSNALNGAGSYIYLTNIRFIKYSDEEYSDLPTIESKIDSLINNLNDATIKNVYVGEKIPKINSFNNIGYKKLMNNAGCQAGAAYGGYYFQFTNQHASMNVYDLTTNTLHSTVNMTAVSLDHCNNACFSNIFYDNNDTFPLIYTSGSQTGTYNHAQVWRIQLVENVFTITKIQEITLPQGTNTDWMWGQIYLDNEVGFMWNAVVAGQVAKYCKFKIPAIFDSNDEVISEITITEEEVQDSFTTYRNVHQQGGVVKNGILYLLDGVPQWRDQTKLYVIDLWGKRLINMVNIQSLLGITYEFEGCGIYNDTLIANTNGNGIYAIYF